MAIQCPACGREYDVTLFQFGKLVRCECGRDIELSHRLEIEEQSEPDTREESRSPKADECD